MKGKNIMGAGRRLLATLLVVLFAAPAPAQPFPTRPVTLVVPYAAGGNVDISARILQGGIGDALGQPIVIENRTGAGGTIAGDYVARSAPDGHTLFVGSNGPILLGPMTMPKPPYQWDKAFRPVSSLAVATNMLLVRPTLPVKSVAELVEFARKNPGKLTLATSSGASINHFLAELLKLKTGITWTEVHYRGNAPAINDLVAAMSMSASSSSRIRCSTSRPASCARSPCSAPSARPRSPTCRRSPRRAFPTCRASPSTACSRPRQRRRSTVERLSVVIRAALAKSERGREARHARLGGARRHARRSSTSFSNAKSAKWTEVMKQANIKVSE